jgi:hypothetical protein
MQPKSKLADLSTGWPHAVITNLNKKNGQFATGVALEKVCLFIHGNCLLLSTYVIHYKLIENKQ